MGVGRENLWGHPLGGAYSHVINHPPSSGTGSARWACPPPRRSVRPLTGTEKRHYPFPGKGGGVGDVLCFGNLQLDVLCRPISGLPAPGSLARVETIELALSGNGGNVAAALGRLDISVELAGFRGADSVGDSFAATQHGLGVGTTTLPCPRRRRPYPAEHQLGGRRPAARLVDPRSRAY